MDRLTLPFRVRDAVELFPDLDLGRGVSLDIMIRRFVALDNLDETTGDAITWRRDGRHVNGEFGLLVTPDTHTMVPGNKIITYDPHRVFFTIMRAAYMTDLGLMEPIYALEMSETVVIGRNTVIENAVIGENVTIGNNVTIGGSGFGYIPEMGKPAPNGRYKIPHIGKVIIEDDVEIGDNTVINRGCLGDTIIRKGAKIDGHVFIAHNAEIGENSVVVAGAVVAGSCKIGRDVWIGAGAIIRNGMSVGGEAFVGQGSNVVKNVPSYTTVMGNPARER